MIRYYGEQKKGKQPKEGAEMITFFAEFRRLYPELALLATHIRNEGERTKQSANREKAEGMVKGTCDIIIVGRPAFCCEMKSKSKTSKISPEQIAYLEQASDNGAFACVAYGYESALEAVVEWLMMTKNG